MQQPEDPGLRHDFAEFYKETFNQTFGVAYRAAGGNANVAYDAAQEAYVVVLKSWLGNNKPTGDLSNYVLAIVVRKVADFYRTCGRWVTLEDEHDNGIDEIGYTQVLETMTLFCIVRDFLDRQPPRRRAVGVLYFLAEFDYAEIAEALGDMKCSTARTHVQRLREKLQPLISQISKDGQGGDQS